MAGTVDDEAPTDPSSSAGSEVKRWIGRLVGIGLALAVYALLGDTAALNESGRVTAGIGTLMAVFWMTEALPLPVTALLPLVLFPLFGAFPTEPQTGEVVLYQPEEGRAVPCTIIEFGLDEAVVVLGSVNEAVEQSVDPSLLSRINVPNPITRAAAPYGSRFIFLYLGGFVLAIGVERWNLHRRIALLTIAAVGSKPSRLVAGFMIATAGLSMWISNTATTVMMLPIALSVVSVFKNQLSGQSNPSETNALDPERFAAGLLLGTAYAASIGGTATLIGTPPNVFFAGFMSDRGNEISFATWMAFALPFACLYLVVAWLLLTKFVFRVRAQGIPGGDRLIRDQLQQLGPMTRGEWTVAVVFLGTALLWIFRTPLSQWDVLIRWVPLIGRLDDTIIGLAGAIALFVIPVDLRRGRFAIDWREAEKLPWGVLLLFGGGLSLASAISASGLDRWIGQGVANWGVSPSSLPAITTTTIIFLTELTSNLATTAAMIPIFHSVALDQGIEPGVILVPATLAASCAFMLPVATPPNAIVYGSGRVSIKQMLAAGIWLNLFGIFLILTLSSILGSWIPGLFSPSN